MESIYSYGYRVILRKTLCYFLLFTCAFVIGTIVETLLFLLFFIPLRKYAGGIHLQSQTACIILSTIITVLAGYYIQQMYGKHLMNSMILVWLLAMLIIVLQAPVKCKNKTYDKMEIQVYKKKTIRIMVSEAIICLIFFGSFGNILIWGIIAAHVVVSISLLLEFFL